MLSVRRSVSAQLGPSFVLRMTYTLRSRSVTCPSAEVTARVSPGGYMKTCHVAHHRRESSRDGRRGDHDLAEQVERARIRAGGDLPQVPHHRPARVEIRGPDQQHAALGVLGRDFFQKLSGDVFPEE